MKKIFYTLFLLTLVAGLSNCAANSGEEVTEQEAPAITAKETPTTDSATVVQNPPTAELVDQEPVDCISTSNGGCGGGDGTVPGTHAEPPSEVSLRNSAQD